MTRPCSIARGNCEPKTIKCQIYDTDQFTMIWRKTVLPFFIHFFFAYFLSTFSLKNMRLGEWYKKGHPVFASLWGESIKCWQCCKMQWEMEKQVSSTRCRGQQQQQKEKEGGGEVKAGVATRWLIPSSISSRSNCWTLLNMTYLWSASCGTKGEAKLQLGNAQWKW